MKRLLALVAIVGLTTALYATTAGGTQQAVTPAQFAALKKQVTKLRTDLNALGVVTLNCVAGAALPVTRYNGYLYGNSNGQIVVTTALDATAQGGTPSAYFIAANPDAACVNFINSPSLRSFSSLKTFKKMPAISLKAVDRR